MRIHKRRGLVALFIAGACSTAIGAEEAKKEVPKKVDLAELASAMQIVPSPGEILAALKEAKAADWSAAAEARAAAIKPVEKMDSTQAAVLLGRRTAEAFLALEAEDAELLEKCSGQILDAGRKLGASDAILEKGKEIKKLADADEWGEIYTELDGVFLAAQEDLKAVEDEESLAIATSAGWLTGISIYAEQASAKYSEASGKALRQGDLVKSLSSQLAALSESTRGKPQVKAMIDAFAKLQPLLTVGQDAAVSEDAVKKISAIADEALGALK